MNYKNKEQNRITLSIAFIATYLTIIIGFSDQIKPPTNEMNFLNDIAYGIFIVFGIIISSLFFLYLVFTALEFDFYKKKTVMFEQDVSKEKIKNIRKFLYNCGVSMIFFSFTYPLYYLLSIFNSIFGIWKAILLWALCMILTYVVLYLIFRDKKIK